MGSIEETNQKTESYYPFSSKRTLRWKQKAFLFFSYIVIVSIPSVYISIESFYETQVFGIIDLPSRPINIVVSFLFFLNAIIGIYLVSYYIIRMQADKIFDAISFIISLFAALLWNYDFNQKGFLFRAATSTISNNLMIMVFGLFLTIFSLLLLYRPKFRLGFFIQILGITIFANSFLFYLRLIEVRGYIFYLMFVILLSVVIFGYSVYYRIKFEYSIDKNF